LSNIQAPPCVRDAVHDAAGGPSFAADGAATCTDPPAPDDDDGQESSKFEHRSVTLLPGDCHALSASGERGRRKSGAAHRFRDPEDAE
jgi:hypothetical protein